jgi:hypothetical protein
MKVVGKPLSPKKELSPTRTAPKTNISSTVSGFLSEFEILDFVHHLVSQTEHNVSETGSVSSLR